MRSRNLFERVFMPPPVVVDFARWGMLADKAAWRTSKGGKRYQIDTETGEILKGNIGQREWDSPAMQNARRDKIEDAMRNIANGNEESTIPDLRNDLEQYGGTNDVTIVKGNSKMGLVHISERHGQKVIPGVLEAVANGKITHFAEGNKTVHIDKDGYRAILALEYHGKKKTWLLTGFDIVEGKSSKGRLADDSGKVSARHASTHTGPILSRPSMGAAATFKERILDMFENVNPGKIAHLRGAGLEAQDSKPALPEPVKPEQLQGPFRWLGRIKI